MKKEFVPYELAVKLKELGFDEPCFVYYNRSNENKPAYPNHGVTQNSLCGNGTTAPLYQQAFRWFREKYKLHTEIRPYTAKYFTIIIQECKDIVKYIEYGGIDLKFNTYEEAELACLEKLIEIVESKSE